MKEKIATLSLERERNDGLLMIEYAIGNGEVHFHSRIEICIVEDGEVEALVNNEKKTLRRGELSIALPYDSHCYITRENSKYCVLILSEEMCTRLHLVLQKKKLLSPFVCGSRHGARILDYLSQIKSKGISELVRLGYVYLILGFIEEEMSAGFSEEEGGSPELFARILFYIHENYNKNLTLSSIATAFGYHPGYISAYFKSHLDIGISRYIGIIRLKHAVLLMRQKKYTVTQIALECGFCSTRTFYRTFLKEFGCSPKDFMEKNEW